VAAEASNQYDGLRARIGTKAGDFDAAQQEISAHFKKVDERIANLMSRFDAAVRIAEKNGAQGRKLEEAKNMFERAITAYRSEPNKTYIASIDRLTEAMEGLALLTTELSLTQTAVK
jgi:hypothetical protein